APDGTAARPTEPSSRTTSTSTVGLPRLSRISRPMMSTMAVMSSSPEVRMWLDLAAVIHGAQANVNALGAGPAGRSFVVGLSCLQVDPSVESFPFTSRGNAMNRRKFLTASAAAFLATPALLRGVRAQESPFRVKYFPVAPGSGSRDTAAAPDGTIWY